MAAALAGAAAAVCLLGYTSSNAEQSLYVATAAPAMAATTRMGYVQRPSTAMYAGTNEDEASLQELLAKSQELLSQDDTVDPGPVQLLSDDDVEIPSEGQKRRIRRMGNIDTSRWQVSPNDVGSVPVQVARLTARVASLASHLAINKKDYVATRRIMAITSERRKLLNYLWKRDPGMAVDLIQELGIRWRTPDKVAKLIPREGPVEILIPENPQRPRTIPRSMQEA